MLRTVASPRAPTNVRSRRGWNMTAAVDFLDELPVRAVLDGELVAFGADGRPDFELVCERMLQRHAQIPLTFLAFDVLSVEGRDVRQEPYTERRRMLEALGLDGPRWRVPEAFEDG